MVTVDFETLHDAFLFAAGGRDLGGAAYVCSQTGAVYVVSADTGAVGEEALPEGLETNARYLPVPDQRDRDLGHALALRFARDELPAAYDEVADCFRRKGAYARFKRLLDDRDALQRWHDFENAQTEIAPRQWCSEHGLDCR